MKGREVGENDKGERDGGQPGELAKQELATGIWQRKETHGCGYERHRRCVLHSFFPRLLRVSSFMTGGTTICFHECDRAQCCTVEICTAISQLSIMLNC